MYLNYYGLSREPFHITPDPEFLFLSRSHEQALASMMYAIDKKKGFAAITGGVGVGKTTVLRYYLDRIDNTKIKPIYIFNPNIPFKSLVAVILQELGVKPLTYDVSDMVHRLHLVLIDEFSAGRDIVVIIDEAQNMPVETLENLRMLSNLETSTDKLIQVILIGQAELDEMLNGHELRQLKQRIAIRSTIMPLSPSESLAYIKHRLAIAGLKDGQIYSIFTRSAVQLIISMSEGIPRIINILCDNAMIASFGRQQYPVDSAIVKEVISEFSYSNKKQRTFSFSWQYAALTALVLLFFAFLFSPYRHVIVSAVTDFTWNRTKYLIIKEEAEPPAPAKFKKEPVTTNIVPASQGKQPDTQEQTTNKDKPDYTPAVRIIGKGDSLTQLIEEVYGIRNRKLIDEKLLEFIKTNNPHIKNINKITVGEKIIFPKLDENKFKLERNS